jgi:RimJ/RimL family protein N-acetyltransferase
VTDPYYCYYVGSRIYLRPIDVNDGLLISKWRNSPEARAAFYTKSTTTPDTHADFVRNRKPNDFIWVSCLKWGDPIGTASLTVDIQNKIAEFGRVYIDKKYTGQGYAQEQDYLVMAFAFEVLYLNMIWFDPLIKNEAIMHVHKKTGGKEIGIDLPGHTNPVGPVMHMQYTPDIWWNTHRKIFIEKYGATFE